MISRVRIIRIDGLILIAFVVAIIVVVVVLLLALRTEVIRIIRIVWVSSRVISSAARRSGRRWRSCGVLVLAFAFLLLVAHLGLFEETALLCGFLALLAVFDLELPDQRIRRFTEDGFVFAEFADPHFVSSGFGQTVVVLVFLL